MSKKPYNGTRRKLVLAFDVGTTYSGISYTVLTPGEVPKISGVNRFPAQESVGGDSKIPTVIYYDKSGNPRAMGAESLDPRNIELADEGGRKSNGSFKMHLRPKSMGSTVDGTKIPRLPKSKTVVDVFADFLRYLLKCARTYICETHAAGNLLWNSVADSIHFILTHPNGWQGPQQSRMRKSAILAGLVPDNPDGRSRIQFVTEGEASLHFCIRSGLADDLVKPGKTVIIADAGGGTIDISSYRFTSIDPIKVEESVLPECKAQGAVFVTRRAHEYLKNFLRGSKYGSSEDIDTIAEVFDKTTKHIFRDDSEPSYIKFAAPKDKDISFNIRNGQLKLDGSVVAGFFERSIQSLLDAIKPQNLNSEPRGWLNFPVSSPLTPVFLVGGFAASPWLFTQLQQRLVGSQFSLCRPDNHTNKAVADGAVSFYLDHFVTERVARTTLGVHGNVCFDYTNADHRRRSATQYIDLAGTSRVPKAFVSILKKGTLVPEATEFRQAHVRMAQDKGYLHFLGSNILSYVGDREHPNWVDETPEDFVTYCSISADLSNVAWSLSPKLSPTNQYYFQLDYDVVIIFGLTETQAMYVWKENGVEKRGPATIVYDEPIMEDDEGELEDTDDAADSGEEDSEERPSPVIADVEVVDTNPEPEGLKVLVDPRGSLKPSKAATVPHKRNEVTRGDYDSAIQPIRTLAEDEKVENKQSAKPAEAQMPDEVPTRSVTVIQRVMELFGIIP